MNVIIIVVTMKKYFSKIRLPIYALLSLTLLINIILLIYVVSGHLIPIETHTIIFSKYSLIDFFIKMNTMFVQSTRIWFIFYPIWMFIIWFIFMNGSIHIRGRTITWQSIVKLI